MNVTSALHFVFDYFYDERTHLLYDYRTSPGQHAAVTLPTPAQIQAQIPNPCGYGTGMEDSVLNGGSLLDALCAIPDPDEKTRALMADLMEGLIRCADHPHCPGYVARSISPADGESFYIDSSRDQYTHWVYAALRYYRKGFCVHREKIAKILVEIGEKCRRDVVAGNNYALCRADGRPGRVSKMWGGVHPHEALRLAMFYLAAWQVSGDPKWAALYREYLEPGLRRTFEFEMGDQRCYIVLQMQYSLRLIWELDPEQRPRLEPFMKKLAEFGEKRAIFNAAEYTKPEHLPALNWQFKPWDQVAPIDMGEYEGFPYLNPAQSERAENAAFYPVREVGEGAAIAALCPGYPISIALTQALDAMLNVLDPKRHSSIYAPLLLACGHLLCQESTGDCILLKL